MAVLIQTYKLLMKRGFALRCGDLSVHGISLSLSITRWSTYHSTLSSCGMLCMMHMTNHRLTSKLEVCAARIGTACSLALFAAPAFDLTSDLARLAAMLASDALLDSLDRPHASSISVATSAAGSESLASQLMHFRVRVRVSHACG